MAKKAVEEEKKPLDVVIPRKVRQRYLKYFSGNPEFRFELDMETFKRYFAEVAHEYQIYHYEGKLAFELDPEQAESRRWYNRYFRIARERLSAHLKRRRKTLPEAETVPAEKVSVVSVPEPSVQGSMIGSDHYRAHLAELSAKMKAELGPKLHQRH